MDEVEEKKRVEEITNLTIIISATLVTIILLRYAILTTP